MSDHAWKQCERRVAAFFGTTRNVGSGSMGRPERSTSDSIHPDLYVECKHGSLARILNAEGREAVRHLGERSAFEGKAPVLCVHEKHMPGFWIICHSADFDRIAAARGGSAELVRSEP